MGYKEFKELFNDPRLSFIEKNFFVLLYSRSKYFKCHQADDSTVHTVRDTSTVVS